MVCLLPSTVLCPAIAIGVYYAIGAYFGQFLYIHVSQIECIIFDLQLHIIPEDWFSMQMLFCVAISGRHLHITCADFLYSTR